MDNPDGRTAFDTQPDLIHLLEQEHAELAAEHADLSVVIRGASFFSGDVALHKAREVAQLVAELTAVGVAAEDIELRGVTADSATTMLGKTSSALYALRVRCCDLARLGDVIGAITSQRNAELRATRWGYPDAHDLMDEMLDRAVARLQARAQRLAQGLGVRLLGVRHLSPSFSTDEPPPNRLIPMIIEAPARTRVSSEELGMDVAHTKRITLTISAAYRISAFD